MLDYLIGVAPMSILLLMLFWSQVIQSIPYTGAASGEAKLHSASWEKVDIPGLVIIGFTHVVTVYIEKLLNEGFRVLNRT